MKKKIVIVMGILVTMSPAFCADNEQPSAEDLRRIRLEAIERRMQADRQPVPPPVAPKPTRRQLTTRTAPPPVAPRNRRMESAFEHGIDFRDIHRAIAQHEQSLQEERDEVIASFIAQRLAALKLAALESQVLARKRMYKIHLSRLQREADQSSHGAAMDLEAKFLGEIGHGLTAGDEDVAKRLQEELNAGQAPDTTAEDAELVRALAMSLGQDPDAHGAPARSNLLRAEEERLTQQALDQMRAEEEAAQRFAREQRAAHERASAEAIRRLQQEEEAEQARQAQQIADEAATQELIARIQRGEA